MKKALWIAGIVLALGEGVRAEPLAGYHIGNSLTWDSQVAWLSTSYNSNGKTAAVGYHVNSSQSAYSISLNPGGVPSGSVITTTTYKAWNDALPNHAWNYVAIQSYNQWNIPPDNHAVTGLEEVTGFTTLINAAKSNPANAGTKFYIYEAWPQSNATPYQTQWNTAYTDLSQPMQFRKQYFKLLYDTLKVGTPNTYLIPVGEVLANLDSVLQTTPINGNDSVYDLYRDTYHMGDNGRYVAHVTVLATVLGQDPATMTLPSFISNLSTPEFKAVANQVVWDTVRSMPETGVVPEPGTLALVGLGLAGVLARRLRKSS